MKEKNNRSEKIRKTENRQQTWKKGIIKKRKRVNGKEEEEKNRQQKQ